MTENKRFEYWKDSDTAYDTKIKYGQYFRIIDKKDMVCLLNKQEKEIKQLKKIREEQIEVILKQKRKIKELEKQLTIIEQSYNNDLKKIKKLKQELNKNNII